MTFEDKETWLNDSFSVVSPFEFYRYIFPVGSFERQGHYEDKKANGLALTITNDEDGNSRGWHTVITDGLEQLDSLTRRDFVITAPIGYSGISRKASNARWLFALTLDIDYVNLEGVKYLLHLADVGFIPRPTFLVNSGNGVHLYFVFDEPVPMYKQYQAELKKLKIGLVEKCWNEKTSYKVDRRETLGLVQGFRMVGSASKIGGGKVLTAYQIGERVSINYLNEFVGEKFRANLSGEECCDKEDSGKMPIKEAAARFPEWYERVVVKGEPAGRWVVKRDLYDWWKKQLESSAVVIGHRYWCCFCLCIYANKCLIDEEELLKDLSYFQKRFNDLSIDGREPFTREEALKCLAAYDDDYVRIPRDTMSLISGIPMVANKRNYQNQRDHLEEARAIRDIRQKRKGTTWNYKGGRPTKRSLVLEYMKEHPHAKQCEVAEALNINRQTAAKWMKER